MISIVTYFDKLSFQAMIQPPREENENYLSQIMMFEVVYDCLRQGSHMSSLINKIQFGS